MVCLLILLIISFNSVESNVHEISLTIDDIEDITVLTVIGFSFGWSYFELKTIFERWGVNFTTTGETETVQSCVNRAPRPVDVDILISEIDETVINEFDVLIVPSGGHWQGLCQNQAVLDLINLANNNGLIMSGICVGVAPLAAAGDILNGTKVAGHSFTGFDVRQAGGIIDPLKRVVVDGRIITGGRGGGPEGGGFDAAPHYDLCLEIVRTLLGESYLQEVEIVGNSISVSTRTSSVLFSNVSTLDIEEVRAIIYPVENQTDVKTIILNATDVAGEFTGIFSGLEIRSFSVDLELETNNRTMEIQRNVSQFDFTTSDPGPTETTASPFPLEITIGIVFVGVVVAILLVYRIRK